MLDDTKGGQSGCLCSLQKLEVLVVFAEACQVLILFIEDVLGKGIFFHVLYTHIYDHK